MDGNELFVLSGAPFDSPRRTGEHRPLADAALLCPVEVGRTFAVVGGFVVPGLATTERGEPAVCPKVAPSTSGPGGEIVYAPFLESLAIEAEMALVIGKTVRSATVEEAADAIGGYTCCNDVTAFQYLADLWLAKSLDSFSSMGPWVRTDLGDEEIARGLAIVARVNGATVQSGTTADYRHTPAEVVGHLSNFFTLNPGDVVTLGTPPVPPEVRPGDVVEIEVEGIGVLTNHIVAG
jgi:2-keto-4-pentenoate hydratase/2-oxohepta-3-ene-1,7-dioic acid hydratase in catechol pathway